MAERRVHKRVKKRVQVMYGVDEMDNRTFARDISVGGMFIDCRRPPDLGTRLHLHVLDPKRDFYVEAEVVRIRKVDQRLRHIEKEGVGVRFLTPAELVLEAVPKAERVTHTNAVVCADADAVRKLLSEQVFSRILVVPVSDPPPSSGSVVEFVIEVQIGAGTTIEGKGRVVQILGSGSAVRAVVEIQGGDSIKTQLEATLAG